MANNLKLITTETFGDLSCNFYRNMNDDILLTREQIGNALEYVNPDDSLSKIHKRHKDRLDNLSVVAKEQSNKKKLPEKKYSRWKTNTFKKLNTLLSYVNTHQDEKLQLSEIIHLVIKETEDTYSIELNDYVDAYKSEFDLNTNPYAIDVINHYKDIRDMFTLTLDSIMEKLHIAENISSNEPRNIFDELAAKILTEKEKE